MTVNDRERTVIGPTGERIAVTGAEWRAIDALHRLAKHWPRRLILFGGAGNSISVRKRADDGSYFVGREVASVNIPSDGGDGGDRS
jgi:hypothetical protein